MTLFHLCTAFKIILLMSKTNCQNNVKKFRTKTLEDCNCNYFAGVESERTPTTLLHWPCWGAPPPSLRRVKSAAAKMKVFRSL